MMAAKLGIHGQLQQICENVNLHLQFLAFALVDVEVPSMAMSMPNVEVEVPSVDVEVHLIKSYNFLLYSLKL